MTLRLNGWFARCSRIASDRRWLWLEASLLVLASTVLAGMLKPEPFSDWLYYWSAAADLGRYERGGTMLLLVALLRPLELPPYTTMLVLNVAAALSILLMSRHIDPSRGKWVSHMVASYLLLSTPYYGLVQLDLLAAACLVAAWILMLGTPRQGRGWRSGALAVVTIAAAVSTRPQFLLVLSALSALMMLIWALSRSVSKRAIPALVVVIMLGATSGFLLDSGLRLKADRSGAIRTNSAVTLYSGLLASSTSYPRCGQWSEEATATMRSDLGKPLADAVFDRIRAQPVTHWVAVMACKSRQIVAPSAFAWWWLYNSPGVDQRLQSQLGDGFFHIRRVVVFSESWLYRLLTLAIYLCAAGVAAKRARRDVLAWLPIVWIGAFWVVHIVFEVQGRYFLSTLLLTPVLCALLIGRLSGTALDRAPDSEVGEAGGRSSIHGPSLG